MHDYTEEVTIQVYDNTPEEEIADGIAINPGFACIVFKAPENSQIEAELSFELEIDINGSIHTETLSAGQIVVINNIPAEKIYPVKCSALLPTGGVYATGSINARMTPGEVSTLNLVMRRVGEDSNPVATNVTVTFNSNGGSSVDPQTFASGGKATRPVDNPTFDGYSFLGWFLNLEDENSFNFDTVISSDIILYAKWEDESVFHETAYHVLEEADGTAGQSWTYVLFGDWPQTIKADNVEVDETISIVVGMFTYYKGSDGAWYVKQKEKAYTTGYKYSDGTTVNKSSENSYKYFKVEPIKWRVLTNNYNGNGKKLLLAENILVNMQYYSTNTNHSVGNFHPNNYKASEIRAYLNGISYTYTPYGGTYYVQDTFVDKGFLQTAFTEPLRSIIAEDTTVDNSAASTTDAGGNLSQSSYACDNTEDRIFLLSEKEVTTEDYGFAAYNVYKGDSNGTTVSSRIRMPTDFAKASGAYQYTTTEGYGGWWWLRSPSGVIDYKHYGRTVNYNGKADKIETVDLQYGGVVPALCINN